MDNAKIAAKQLVAHGLPSRYSCMALARKLANSALGDLIISEAV
jgi:hypothetical protein